MRPWDPRALDPIFGTLVPLAAPRGWFPWLHPVAGSPGCTPWLVPLAAPPGWFPWLHPVAGSPGCTPWLGALAPPPADTDVGHAAVACSQEIFIVRAGQMRRGPER